MSFNMPSGWKITQLDNFTDIVLGQSPPSSTYNIGKNGLPFFQGKAEFGYLYPTPQKWCDSPKKTANQGDVLISVRAPVGSTNICVEKSCIGRGLAAIRGLAGIDTLFLIHLIRTFEDSIAQKGTGTTFKAISGSILRNLELPLPPLNEQKRIVAKIEALQTRSTVVKEELEAIKPLLNQFRQSVLAAAFRGDLTKDWREQNPDVEPAEVLLERINQEATKHTIKKSKSKVRSLEDFLINNDIDNIPSEWKLIQVRNISIDSFYGPRFSKDDYDSNGIPSIRTTDMTKAGLIRLTEDTPRVKVPKDRIDDYKVIKNDLLITRSGSIGMMAIFRDDYLAIPGAYLIRFRFSSLIPVDYIFGYLKSPRGQNLLGLNATSVTQANINAEAIKNLPIPIPPLEEQKEIVRCIESLFKLADSIEQKYQQAKINLETLNQSILAKAFRGELVPQDPDDEPASILLEKIKEEREKAKPKKSKSKKQDKQLDIPGI